MKVVKKKHPFDWWRYIELSFTTPRWRRLCRSQQTNPEAGLQKSFDILQSWADPRSCSLQQTCNEYLYLNINKCEPEHGSSRTRAHLSWRTGEHLSGEPENISMFSTCSELTPRAPIPDGRMDRFMHPWCQPTLYIFELTLPWGYISFMF